jgi:transcription antitermination factor NusG
MIQGRFWRVFYTDPRAEKKCEERLYDRHIEVFLPTHTVLRQWSDRKKKIVEPLFRNYIFAHVDERDRLRVLQTEGIVRCVSFNGQPAVVSDEEIEYIRQVISHGGEFAVVDYVPRPSVGSKVIVTEGPMRGLRGEVREHRGQTHILVSIAAIRQALRVNIPATWVEALEAA